MPSWTPRDTKPCQRPLPRGTPHHSLSTIPKRPQYRRAPLSGFAPLLPPLRAPATKTHSPAGAMAVCTYPAAVTTLDQRYPLSCYQYTRLDVYFCRVPNGNVLLTVFTEPRLPFAPCAQPVACSTQPGQRLGPAVFPTLPDILVPVAVLGAVDRRCACGAAGGPGSGTSPIRRCTMPCKCP